MNAKLIQTIENFKNSKLDSSREAGIEQLAQYIFQKINAGKIAKLNFICTHNSRRSQFAQIWGQTLANYLDLPIECFSGGVEVTEFNSTAVNTLINDGFEISKLGEKNPHFLIKTDDSTAFFSAFSKLYDDQANPADFFAAIMTCDHADETCPFISRAEIRIPLRYEDPKAFDRTELEVVKYRERSHQIGADLLLCFKSVKNRL